MIRRMVAVSAGCAFLVCGMASAQQSTGAPGSAAERAAHDFGARPTVQQVSLSPDGTHYAALLSIKGAGTALVVGSVDGATPVKTLTSSSGRPERLNRCSWASDTRLICSIYTTRGAKRDILGFDRLVAINSDGSNLKMLSAPTSSNALDLVQGGGQVIDWYGDAQGSSILMTRQIVPEYSTGTHLAESKSGYAVERVDPVTFKRTVIEVPNDQAQEYISDGIGNVRIMGLRPKDEQGYVGERIKYVYRKPDSRSWLPLSVVSDTGNSPSGFDPYAVDPTTNVAYGFAKLDGRTALFKVALDGSGKREVVFARPDVDVDGLVRIGRKHRVVGVSFSTDREQTVFFDPELSHLRTSLAKALPNSPLVTFVDSSVDENRLLLRVGSDNDPGQYMVFDKKTRHLSPLMDIRPDLANVKLATVKSVTYAAADGTQVPAYLTLPPGSDGKNIPAIVMPHGGPSSRDEWGFDWLAQFFAARGYAVLQPNYRGSAGYGDGWYQQNGFKSWRTAIGDINDGGRWLVKQGITAPDKLAIVGWSYGGYAALQTSVLDPDLFKAIVAIAPVTDLNTLRDEHRDFADFYLVDNFIGKGPHLKEGSPAQNVGAIKAPVLLFHGDHDENVGVGESRMMSDRLKAAGKHVEYIEFAGLDHQLDDSEVRAQMLAKADGFLRTAMHLPQ